MLLVLVVFVSALLLTSFPWGNFVAAAADDDDIEIHNPLTAFKQCSNGDKKWHICCGGNQPVWYCPTGLNFNSSQVE